MNTSSPPPLPQAMQFEAMPQPLTIAAIAAALLRTPGRIVYELYQRRDFRLGICLLAVALVAVAAYGIVVGSLSGGLQMLIAPAKLVLGIIAAVLICLPSLYIFISLAGIDARINTVAGALFGTVCLSALLLIGFAPVAWIFSQSTDSMGFMGTLHLIFWLIGIGFGLRILRGMCRFGGARSTGHLRIWTMIFVLVCLQMTTTLRPIIARSEAFFPRDKRFFLSYWVECVTK